MLDIPLIVTEQYPRGLGRTIPELDISHAKGIFEKTKFSMIVPEVSKQLDSLCGGNVQCVVLFGIEVSTFRLYYIFILYRVLFYLNKIISRHTFVLNKPLQSCVHLACKYMLSLMPALHVPRKTDFLLLM